MTIDALRRTLYLAAPLNVLRDIENNGINDPVSDLLVSLRDRMRIEVSLLIGNAVDIHEGAVLFRGKILDELVEGIHARDTRLADLVHQSGYTRDTENIVVIIINCGAARIQDYRSGFFRLDEEFIHLIVHEIIACSRKLLRRRHREGRLYDCKILLSSIICDSLSVLFSFRLLHIILIL